MEASTIIPTPRIKPVNVIIFKVIPNIFIANKVMTIESGIEIEIFIVDLKFCKKINKIITASKRPCQAESINVLIVSRMASVSSYVISIVISDGNTFFACSIFS